jgi:hypothetical protein
VWPAGRLRAYTVDRRGKPTSQASQPARGSNRTLKPTPAAMGIFEEFVDPPVRCPIRYDTCVCSVYVCMVASCYHHSPPPSNPQSSPTRFEKLTTKQVDDSLICAICHAVLERPVVACTEVRPVSV